MKRTPNHYGSHAAAGIAGDDKDVVIYNDEFSRFISGQTELTPELEAQLKKALKRSDTRLKIFLAAYVQKGMGRLVKVMQSLDRVDQEMLAEWRIKFSDTGELLDLFRELSMEKHRTIDEMLSITDKFGTESGEEQLTREQGSGEHGLSSESKRHVVRFFKDKVQRGG